MGAFFRKYNVASHVYIPMVKRAVVDFAVGADWTPAAGDCKIIKDGGAAANVGTLPVAIVSGNGAVWDFALSATELSAAKVIVTVVDSATKAVEDQGFVVETFGNASAMFQEDWSVATPANFASLVIDANGRIDVSKWLGSAVNALISGRVDANMQALASAVITAAAFAAGAIDASAIATDAIGSAEFAASAVAEIAAAILATPANLLLTDAAGKVTLSNPAGIQKNVAYNNFTFLLVLSSDHVTPATGKTITATRSIDGAAFGACTNSATEIGATGVYKINLSAADLNGDNIMLSFAATASDTRFVAIVTEP